MTQSTGFTVYAHRLLLRGGFLAPRDVALVPLPREHIKPSAARDPRDHLVKCAGLHAVFAAQRLEGGIEPLRVVELRRAFSGIDDELAVLRWKIEHLHPN